MPEQEQSSLEYHLRTHPVSVALCKGRTMLFYDPMLEKFVVVTGSRREFTSAELGPALEEFYNRHK